MIRGGDIIAAVYTTTIIFVAVYVIVLLTNMITSQDLDREHHCQDIGGVFHSDLCIKDGLILNEHTGQPMTQGTN